MGRTGASSGGCRTQRGRAAGGKDGKVPSLGETIAGLPPACGPFCESDLTD